MIYIYVFVFCFVIYLLWYIYQVYSINKNQISIIFKRALYFRSNSIIRQTIIASTFKLILRLIKKTIFKI